VNNQLTGSALSALSVCSGGYSNDESMNHQPPIIVSFQLLLRHDIATASNRRKG
jgi:hypothetical protein